MVMEPHRPAPPDWVPGEARRYLEHVSEGRAIRAIARDRGVHASTILRQVRKTEARRDDALVDMALERLQAASAPKAVTRKGNAMPRLSDLDPALPDDATLDNEAARVLGRLAEAGACLAIARDMDMGVVMRTAPDGTQLRTAVVARGIAEAMALKGWIATTDTGRIARYGLTGAGRMALKRLGEVSGGGDTAASAQHCDIGTREMEDDTSRRRRARYGAAESPLLSLSRRTDRRGEPFLSSDLVAAGERLREDFELSRIGAAETPDWQSVLAGDTAPSLSAAAGRVAAALADLGPGLGDVVLRCCCRLEGLESVEKSLGWSARSGKIVLRIALLRLRRHYDESGADLQMIG